MTIPDFIALLEAHDWYFDRADDPRAYSKGAASQKKLLYLCQQQPELFRLYNYAENCTIRSLPFDFQSILGSPGKDEKHQTKHANHTMKELFQSFFDICLKPVVEAIDRAAAALAGGTVKPATEAAPAAEKPAKAPKAAKTAPAPTPEPEPEQAAPAISEARLKATVKTLDNDGKLKLKAYFQKKFSYNTMAEIAEEHRADIHAAALKIGATDTDPDAQAEDVGDM